MVNFPTTIHTADGQVRSKQACVFGRVVENLDGFAVMCKRLRYEGTKVMTTRRAAWLARGAVPCSALPERPVRRNGGSRSWTTSNAC